MHVVDELDHHDLNEHPAFHAINPSSEHIAMFLFRSLKEPLHTERYSLLQRRSAGDRFQRRGLLR